LFIVCAAVLMLLAGVIRPDHAQPAHRVRGGRSVAGAAYRASFLLLAVARGMRSSSGCLRAGWESLVGNYVPGAR
jgi:hypothetical protein